MLKLSVSLDTQLKADVAILAKAFPSLKINYTRLKLLSQRLYPTMPRQLAQLAKYSPSARVNAPPSSTGTSVVENNNWSFFTDYEDTYMLSYEILGRSGFDARNHCDFIYLGNENKVGGVTCVKMSHYEAKQVGSFVSDILDQIDASPSKGRDITPPLPFFKNNIARAKDRNTREGRKEFWEKPDIQLASVRGRLVFNFLLGEFELALNNPVSDDITKKLKGWVGPTIYFSGETLKNLEAFITSVTTASTDDTRKRCPLSNPKATASDYKKGRYESRRTTTTTSAVLSPSAIADTIVDTID